MYACEHIQEFAWTALIHVGTQAYFHMPQCVNARMCRCEHTHTQLCVQCNLLTYMVNCILPDVMQQRYLLSRIKTARLQQIDSVWTSGSLCLFSPLIYLLVTCWFIGINNPFHLNPMNKSITLVHGCLYVCVQAFELTKENHPHIRQCCEPEDSVAFYEQYIRKIPFSAHVFSSPLTFPLHFPLLSLYSSPYPGP